MLKPPIVTRGPWKPTGTTIPSAIRRGSVERQFDWLSGSIEVLADAYLKVTLFELLLQLLLGLISAVYRVMRSAF